MAINSSGIAMKGHINTSISHQIAQVAGQHYTHHVFVAWGRSCFYHQATVNLPEKFLALFTFFTCTCSVWMMFLESGHRKEYVRYLALWPGESHCPSPQSCKLVSRSCVRSFSWCCSHTCKKFTLIMSVLLNLFKTYLVSQHTKT